MAMNKKAITFSILVVVFLAIFAVVFFTRTKFLEREKQESVEARVLTMNDFLNDFFSDSKRASYISGYRSFIAMEEYVSNPDHGFLLDPEQAFVEVFMNGTINGEYMSIMENASFSDYQKRVNKISKRIDILFNASVLHVSMSHSDPWSVDVFIDFSVKIHDLKGIASWDLNRTVKTNIPIVDLKDPLYAVNTGLPVTVKRWNGAEFIAQYGGVNDTSNLTAFVNETYYINSTRAPSFLMRFSNNLSNSSFGIESVVNLQDVYLKEVEVFDNRSVVDYIYFNGFDSTAVYCNFSGLPAWFKLDNGTVLSDVFETSEISYDVCS